MTELNLHVLSLLLCTRRLSGFNKTQPLVLEGVGKALQTEQSVLRTRTKNVCLLCMTGALLTSFMILDKFIYVLSAC